MGVLSVPIEHFGASVNVNTLFQKLGITTDPVIIMARETLEENT